MALFCFAYVVSSYSGDMQQLFVERINFRGGQFLHIAPLTENLV